MYKIAPLILGKCFISEYHFPDGVNLAYCLLLSRVQVDNKVDYSTKPFAFAHSVFACIVTFLSEKSLNEKKER